MVYKSLTFEQLQNLVYIGTLSSRWLTDFRVQMTSMFFFRYLHAYEHFELGAEGFTQKSCNCLHPSDMLKSQNRIKIAKKRNATKTEPNVFNFVVST